jgi:NAD-dependent SIR2 family protein deacetylase
LDTQCPIGARKWANARFRRERYLNLIVHRIPWRNLEIHLRSTVNLAKNLAAAADWIRDADGLLITAGAGMSVDSGLPDFRGDAGFWKAYPALGTRRLSFQDMASGEMFKAQPELAWGFYGHRLNLYRNTVPHQGFAILKRWGELMRAGAFVFTSNVDGQFQKAGFSDRRIVECHGSIHVLQCSKACSNHIWPANLFEPQVDDLQCRLLSSPPLCERCGSVARPNILMFEDYDWIEDGTKMQDVRRHKWLSDVKRLVVIELGAGKAIPTVRNHSERHGPRIVRINVNDFRIVSGRGVGLPGKALDILHQLDERL